MDDPDENKKSYGTILHRTRIIFGQHSSLSKNRDGGWWVFETEATRNYLILIWGPDRSRLSTVCMHTREICWNHQFIRDTLPTLQAPPQPLQESKCMYVHTYALRALEAWMITSYYRPPPVGGLSCIHSYIYTLRSQPP